jgi:hypothetical protein
LSQKYEMADHLSNALSTFFLLRASYDLERLQLLLADGSGRPTLEVVFSMPRAFRTFAESDSWHYLSGYKGRQLVQCADPGCGIELSGNAPYLADYQANARAQDVETTFSCLIRTPDHCVEVICFEEPTLQHL